MKDREDQIIKVIKLQQNFQKLLNDTLNLAVNIGNHYITLDTCTFNLSTVVGTSPDVDDASPNKGIIFISPDKTIMVNDPKLEEKQIIYRIKKESNVTIEIANDILKHFIKLY